MSPISAAVYSPSICWLLSLAAPCCWSPPSGRLPSRHPERRDCDESGTRTGKLLGGRSRSFCPRHGRLSGAPQPHHHVSVRRNDAARSGAQPGRVRPLPCNLQGQVFTLFIITVAACEAGIALALILMLSRS